jgi:hypothetical protein
LPFLEYNLIHGEGIVAFKIYVGDCRLIFVERCAHSQSLVVNGTSINQDKVMIGMRRMARRGRPC